MNLHNYISNKINENKPLDFGTIFSDSFELFKKTWIQGLIHQLFVMLLMLPFIIAVYIPFIMLIFAQAGNLESSNSEVFSTFIAGFSIGYILFFFIAMIILGGLSLALNAALYRIIKMLDHGEQVQTSDFFYFFKGRHIGKLIGLMFISMAIATVAALACYLPIFYVMVPLTFFVPFFAFNPELGVGDIISFAFKLGTKKWLIVFGLIIISSLLASIVGFLLCGIGTLFTAAFVYHPVYLVYKETIGFDNDSPESSLQVFNYTED
ncbi:hypothetical protein RM697_13120 [Ichthyenterobacterium sp. W332]|uniref:Glycerophosphoryl diester phosphodiesterase membrane domain-containing protein n=1 Tax=Microcosmobacter mediterraneus TaxID=3075607 RepID=A0ABU2YN48_9FLAO|nr:hypothetical protein [Ichthyenterobacterium sp. W332]MDT0559594.1 hypothetical protein [Ichthyenterobacterium sp. W332]